MNKSFELFRFQNQSNCLHILLTTDGKLKSFLKEKIEAVETDLSELRKWANIELIRKTFKITTEEPISDQNFLNSIVTRVAVMHE